jgi:peptidoglycan/xylan/chitin deacetylase (PgdA/CDA1 family)
MTTYSYDWLRAFYTALHDAAPVLPLGAWDGVTRAALVRHDIDLSVRLAYEVFRVEQELGLRTTYLFLTTCPTYNVQAAANRAMIREMADAGAEVGLHFDPTLYGTDDPEALRVQVEKEAAILEDVAGQAVRTISLHNPTSHGRYPLFEGYVNAYQPPYFDPEWYLSDSCMSFRDKDPFAFAARARERTVQVLLHPLHFSEAGGDYRTVIARQVDQMFDDLDAMFQPVNAQYRAQVPERRAWSAPWAETR